MGKHYWTASQRSFLAVTDVSVIDGRAPKSDSIPTKEELVPLILEINPNFTPLVIGLSSPLE